MAKKKIIPVPQTPKATVDSAEIDDLFSVFSSKKTKIEAVAVTGKAGRESVAEKKPKAVEDEKAELKEASPNDPVEASEDTTETLSEDLEADPVPVPVKKGSLFDPSRDDFSPLNTHDTLARHDDDDFFDSRGSKRKARALTEDGLPIYTTSELRIGLGGGTDLCPFDCNCCF